MAQNYLAVNPQPCPICKVNVSMDCGYSHFDNYYDEFDCEHPDGENLECGGCPHTACNNCRQKALVEKERTRDGRECPDACHHCDWLLTECQL